MTREKDWQGGERKGEEHKRIRIGKIQVRQVRRLVFGTQLR